MYLRLTSAQFAEDFIERPATPPNPEIQNCGSTLTSTSYALIIDGPASGLNHFYDVWWSDVEPDLLDLDATSWNDPNSSEEATSFPHTMAPVTGLPNDGRSIWFRLRSRELVSDPFDDVPGGVCEFTSVTTQSSSADVTFNTLTRAFYNNSIPTSFTDKFGVEGLNSQTSANVLLPTGATKALSVSMGVVTETAANATELVSKLTSLPPGGVIHITSSFNSYTIPASASGTQANPKYITGNGGLIGTGGRNTIEASDIVFANAQSGSIYRAEGDRIGFYNMTPNAGLAGPYFEMFDGNNARRPTDCFILGCESTSDDVNRDGVVLGSSDGANASTPLRLLVAFCDFHGFDDKALHGVGRVANYPEQHNYSYSVFYKNIFRDFSGTGEILSVKAPGMAFIENLFDFTYTSASMEGLSLRHTDGSVLLNNYFMGLGSRLLYNLGYNHIYANNTEILRGSPTPIITETPGATTAGVGFNWHRRNAMAHSEWDDNIFISDVNAAFDSFLQVAEGFGDGAYQSWQSLSPQSGFNIEGNRLNNIYVGPSASIPAYNDATANGRYSESVYNAANPQGLAMQQRAMQQSGLVATSASPTTVVGTKTYTGAWEGGSDVVASLPECWLDGSLLSFT